MDRVVKGAAAAPVGAIGAALWVLGAGISGVGRASGVQSLQGTGDALCDAGGTALGTSKDMVEGAVGTGNVADRNRALIAFEKHSKGTGYIGEQALHDLVADMPELYIGLEGILGSLATVHHETAELIKHVYADPGGNGSVNWDGFYRFWREVVEDHEGRLAFYHRIIFTHYDVGRSGELTLEETSRLLDDLYYSPQSAFAGDSRIPAKELLLASIEEMARTEAQEGEGAAPDGAPAEAGGEVGGRVRITLSVLAPVMRGEFSAAALPEPG